MLLYKYPVPKYKLNKIGVHHFVKAISFLTDQGNQEERPERGGRLSRNSASSSRDSRSNAESARVSCLASSSWAVKKRSTTCFKYLQRYLFVIGATFRPFKILCCPVRFIRTLQVPTLYVLALLIAYFKITEKHCN